MDVTLRADAHLAVLLNDIANEYNMREDEDQATLETKLREAME